MLEVDGRPYYQILHVLLREADFDYDPERTALAALWAKRNSITLRKVLSAEERRVLGVLLDYWDKHKVTPDRKMMDELLRDKQKNQGMLDVMAEYDRHAPDLEQVSHLSLDMYLDQRKADYEKYKVSRVLDIAGTISVASVPNRDKSKPPYSGPRDALKYILQAMQEGLLIDDRKSAGGDTATEGGKSLLERFRVATEGRTEQIRMGIKPLDDHLSIGHAQGNHIKYLGIAGFTGHGKSTLLFSMIYHAAAQGYRVLLVPRECSVEQAWDRLIYLHAHQIGRAHELPAMKKFLRPGFARAEYEPIFAEIIADMERQGIRIEVAGANTWAEVETTVQAHVDDPYDVLAIDYIAHLQVPPGTRESDHHNAILEYFRKAQALSIDYENGRGLVVITPAQVNKEGVSEALREDGVFRNVGCLEQYTGAGRDFDALIGHFSDKDLQDSGLCRISCVKSRDDMFPPFYMRFDAHTQRLHFISDADAGQMIGDKWTKPKENLEKRKKSKASYNETKMKTEDID